MHTHSIHFQLRLALSVTLGLWAWAGVETDLSAQPTKPGANASADQPKPDANSPKENPGQPSNPASTPPEAEKPAQTDEGAGLIVRDTLTLVRSKFEDHYNAIQTLDSTLPRFMTLPHRSQAEGEDADQPMPVGIITFAGNAPAKAIAMQMNVTKGKGRLLSAWPTPQAIRRQKMAWRSIELNPASENGEPTDEPTQQDVEKLRWLSPLNQTSRLSVGGSPIAMRNEPSDQPRFLVYDLTLEAPTPPKITYEAGKYQVSAKGRPHQRAWLFKVERGNKIRTAAFDDLQSDPSTRKAKKPEHYDHLHSAFKPFRDALRQADLGKPEIDQTVGIVRRYVREEKGQLVAVFALDQGWIDKRLRLNLSPKPSRLVRVALVILIKADPEQSKRIEQLISELGAEDWTDRREAQAELAEFGKAAQATLKKHTDSQDAEIAFRVRTLLQKLEDDEPKDK